ncbi:MAG: winged helix-turn-helix domain-containing protein [Pseudomonadota bacterium]
MITRVHIPSFNASRPDQRRGASQPCCATTPSSETRAAAFAVAGWRVDPRTRSLSRGEASCRLSPRALTLLVTLAEHPGEALDRDTLMDAIWPNTTVSDESLTQAVKELRRAFGGEGRRLVETIPRFGYRLTGEVLRDGMPPHHASSLFDIDAYQLCLDGHAALSHGGRTAVSRFQSLTGQAARHAPDFAFARAAHAIALGCGWLYQRDRAESAEAAVSEAEAALALKPDLGLAHTAKAFALGAVGRAAEAVRALETALQFGRNDAEALFVAARLLFVLGRYRAAATLAERAATLSPTEFWPLHFGVRAAAVFDPARSRRNAATCLKRVEATLRIEPEHARARNLLGPLLATLGRKDEAVAAIEAQPDTETTLQVYDAIALAMVGEKGRSISTLQGLAERGWRHGDWLAAEPAFAAMTDDGRYRRTLATINHG